MESFEDRMQVAETAFVAEIDPSTKFPGTPGSRLHARRPRLLLAIPEAQTATHQEWSFLWASESLGYGDSTRPGSVVWLIKGDRLLKTAPEQLRLASRRETILEELAKVKKALPWTFTRMAQSLGKQWFEDVSQELPDEEQWQESMDQEMARPSKRLKGKQPRPANAFPGPKRPARGRRGHVW